LIGTRRFIFLGGAEGSGTTLLLRRLSHPAMCASLGGNHVKIPDTPEALRLFRAFELANRQAWDRHADLQQGEASRRTWREVAAQILRSPAFARQSHFLFKRSFPFAMPRDGYTPDLWDVFDILPNARCVLIYRDPCASTYSALRRGFDTDLRRLAVVCSEQLSNLAAQVMALGPDNVRVISYRRLCREPARALAPIAEFCDLPAAAIEASIAAEPLDQTADRRYADELAPEAVSWLHGFFDARRRAQWPVLEASPGAA
jgi:hypothetical protein